jgi:hypothetical protein
MIRCPCVHGSLFLLPLETVSDNGVNIKKKTSGQARRPDREALDHSAVSSSVNLLILHPSAGVGLLWLRGIGNSFTVWE